MQRIAAPPLSFFGMLPAKKIFSMKGNVSVQLAECFHTLITGQIYRILFVLQNFIYLFYMYTCICSIAQYIFIHVYSLLSLRSPLVGRRSVFLKIRRTKNVYEGTIDSQKTDFSTAPIGTEVRCLICTSVMVLVETPANSPAAPHCADA